MRKKIERIFKNYRQMKNELSVLEFQLSNFAGISNNELIESMCFSHPEGERVQSSSLSDKTAKVAINYEKVAEKMNDEFFTALLIQYRTLKSELDFFEYCINRLSGKLPEIIHDMVINKMSWGEMARKYNISEPMLCKYRKKAIGDIAKLYEARDKQMEQYILS